MQAPSEVVVQGGWVNGTFARSTYEKLVRGIDRQVVHHEILVFFKRVTSARLYSLDFRVGGSIFEI